MKIGSIVILLDPDHQSLDLLKNYGNKIPEINTYYTVRNFHTDGFGQLGIRLEEIINPPKEYREGVVECCFLEKLFQEIEDNLDLNQLINEIENKDFNKLLTTI